jgi:hypothetical protein
VEKLADPVSPVEEVLRRCPAKQLMQLYKIAKFEGVDQFLQLIAAARGKLQKGGTTNSTAAARLVLQDWNNGVIPYFTHPPARASAYDSAELVGSWAREFNADEVFTQERAVVLAALPEPGEDERPFMQVGPRLTQSSATPQTFQHPPPLSCHFLQPKRLKVFQIWFLRSRSSVAWSSSPVYTTVRIVTTETW